MNINQRNELVENCDISNFLYKPKYTKKKAIAESYYKRFMTYPLLFTNKYYIYKELTALLFLFIYLNI